MERETMSPKMETQNSSIVLVTIGAAGLMMLAWRLGYVWWLRRSLPHA